MQHDHESTQFNSMVCWCCNWCNASMVAAGPAHNLDLFGKERSMTTKSNKTKTPAKRTKPGSQDRAVISQLVLDGMRGGLSAFKACQAAGVPNSTFLRWVDDDATLAENYARAREDLIERMATEIMEISDQDVGVAVDGKKDWAAVQKHRLQVDTRKWLLSKLAPKKFGDKIEVSGDPANPLVQRIERVVVKA